MSNIHTEAELRKILDQEGYLQSYPYVWGLADGTFYAPESEKYARSRSEKEGIQVYKFEPIPAIPEPVKPLKPTPKEEE
jgi:hypothetical protein